MWRCLKDTLCCHSVPRVYCVSTRFPPKRLWRAAWRRLLGSWSAAGQGAAAARQKPHRAQKRIATWLHGMCHVCMVQRPSASQKS